MLDNVISLVFQQHANICIPHTKKPLIVFHSRFLSFAYAVRHFGIARNLGYYSLNIIAKNLKYALYEMMTLVCHFFFFKWDFYQLL